MKFEREKKTRYITGLRRKRGCELNTEGCKNGSQKKQKENGRKKKEIDINDSKKEMKEKRIKKSKENKLENKTNEK